VEGALSEEAAATPSATPLAADRWLLRKRIDEARRLVRVRVRVRVGVRRAACSNPYPDEP
jgi:hypothetical protein